MVFDCCTEAINRLRTIEVYLCQLNLLLDPSSINALIIITLLFEILTLLGVVRSLDSIVYEPMLNNA